MSKTAKTATNGTDSGRITVEKRRALQKSAFDLAQQAAKDGDAENFVKLATLLERQYQADRRSRKPVPKPSVATLADRKADVAAKLAGLRIMK